MNEVEPSRFSLSFRFVDFVHKHEKTTTTVSFFELLPFHRMFCIKMNFQENSILSHLFQFNFQSLIVKMYRVNGFFAQTKWYFLLLSFRCRQYRKSISEIFIQILENPLKDGVRNSLEIGQQKTIHLQVIRDKRTLDTNSFIH